MDPRITDMKKLFLFITGLASLFACSPKNQVTLLPAGNFETEIDGKATSLYTISNGDITVQLTNFGARVVSIWAPDRNGVHADICPGYDNIESYVNNPGERFLGPVVGPVANRICKGSFTLDGVTYNTPLNNDGNTLHGGFEGVDLMVWDVVSVCDSSITMSVLHPDGKEGWPGNLSISATFSLTPDNEMEISYTATTDKATPVNLSSHTFFNLTGDTSASILGHELVINASHTTPIDSLLIPTGEIVPLDGSPLDFRIGKTVGCEIDRDDAQLRNGNGYDHNWCLDKTTDVGIEFAASMYEPQSGRYMEVWTDQPGLQFYCGNFFTGNESDKHGNPIGYRCAFVFETQKWPDAVNHGNFPDTILLPGETYTHTCIYRFSYK